jgi:hypothetical protein
MPDPPPAELDVNEIVAVLNRHRVRYVVIGGFGALLQGAPVVTVDFDITPASDRANLGRLAGALREMHARLRASGVEEPLDIPLDARTFDRFPTVLTLRTRFGDLDISLRPSAPAGERFDYKRLARHAVAVELPEPVSVAALDDIIASKQAAARPKDLAVLPLLYELRDQLGRRRAD